jgi:hypothetical protein
VVLRKRDERNEMRNNKILLIILTLSLTLFGGAVATGNLEAREMEKEKLLFFSGNDIYSWCQSDYTLAEGYTAGSLDQSHRAFNSLTAESGGSVQGDIVIDLAIEMAFDFCEPPHVKVGQVTDAFCAFLRDKPEKRSEPAAMLFTEAMKRVWPCKKP